MGSPAMDHEAGYQQARIDMMRTDIFAVVNHRHKVLDWNQDNGAWNDGYSTFLFETAQSPATEPRIAALAWELLFAASAPLYADAQPEPAAA